MQIKKLIISLFFIFCFLPIRGQLLGIGSQYAQKSDGQFFVNVALPTFTKSNALHLFNLSGIDYTTSGGASLSGLQLKPIQLATYLSDFIMSQSKCYGILIGLYSK